MSKETRKFPTYRRFLLPFTTSPETLNLIFNNNSTSICSLCLNNIVLEPLKPTDLMIKKLSSSVHLKSLESDASKYFKGLQYYLLCGK